MAESGGGFYKRFTLSNSKSNSLPFLLPSENEEFISDIKQPSLCSVNLTDSFCSSSISSNNNYCSNNNNKSSDLDINNCFSERNNVPDIIDTTWNSEPEDMQDFTEGQSNSKFSYSDVLKLTINNDDYKHNCSLTEKCIEPVIDYRKTYTSTPLPFCNKKMSISLQDVSTVDIFPLESKTMTAFSTETIQTQSISSTTKSKDSGFQRSASCLSLNSGNRSYDHVQSKVKQYIKDIKDSEAQRKKQQQQNPSLETPKSNVSRNLIDEFNKNQPKDMIKTIKLLKSELKEKDTILNELQQNYNCLLERYAEAVNQIDLMRLRTSLNYSSYRSDCYSDLNNDINCSNKNNESTNSVNCNSSLWNSRFVSSNSDTNKHLENNNNSDNNDPDSYQNGSEFLTQQSDKLQSKLIVEQCTYEDGISNNDSYSKIDMSISNFELQSVNHLTHVNSVKSLTLRPISRMYSSSSRLDKKIPPLPSSLIVKSDNLYRNEVFSNKNNLGITHSYSDLSVRSLGNDNKSDTLIAGEDDFSTPYLNRRSISQLELPRVDPFDKVKKWQASLPTISLIGSQSSSSFGSLDNIEIKPHFSSLQGKFNDELFDSTEQVDDINNKHKLKRSKLNVDKSYLISRSDQDLSNKNNPKVYSEFYEKRFSKNSIQNKKTESTRQVKNTKRLKHNLKRSNAVEDVISSDECLSNNENLMRCSVSLVNNEKLLSVADQGSSITSSILSLPKDKELTKYNGDGNKKQKLSKTVNTKAIEKLSISQQSNKEISNRSGSVSVQFSEDPLSQVDNSKNETDHVIHESQINKDVSSCNNNRKRVCFSAVNGNTEAQKPIQKYAWDSPKHINTLCDSDIKSKPFINIQSVINNRRTEKLKSYTEILSNINNNNNKESIDIGLQVTNEIPVDIKKDSKQISSSTYHENLEEFDQYIKHAIREVKKIHNILEGLQTSGFLYYFPHFPRIKVELIS
ncbi:uncharacterized protein LOC142328961 isoform X2 [Lycorma delicatula]|uniref:uncharacterized protein LOC142328961 isoform X2 n=1 Tax=Lycorma delicatula TaxID=130591 RepID=UPI003F51170C